MVRNQALISFYLQRTMRDRRAQADIAQFWQCLSAAAVWKKEANLSGKRRRTECLSCYRCEEKRDLKLRGTWGSEMFFAPCCSYFRIKTCPLQAFVSSHTAAVWWMCFLYPLRTNDPLFLTLWFGEFVYPGVHYSLSSPIVLPLPRREIPNTCG